MRAAVQPSWKEALAGRIPEELAREIDVFETEIELRRQGKLDEKIFAETRLRRGVYGQRYDNGQRHDGLKTQTLEYPSGTLVKGPNTLWDAPGMQRIKIPFGSVTTEQMEVLAELADDYSDGILHVTTRQDFQLHFVHIDDTPDLMRRLAAAGITTREACGNSVRNVTACPLSGVCATEAFDVTPYARALSYFLLGHPDAQDFGRKFKIAFSGCAGEPCGLTSFHDLGFIARQRVANEPSGKVERGFETYVGGGLGSVPYQAKLFDPFLPERELLPLAQAVCRVFARLGERKNRARARLKFLVSTMGIDEFRKAVLEERAKLPPDTRFDDFIADAASGRPPRGSVLRSDSDGPSRPPGELSRRTFPPAFDAWAETNVAAQRQPGYAVAAVTLPLGDLSSVQMRRLADIARRFGDGAARTTVDQNLVLRWIPANDLPELHGELVDIGLGGAGAGTIVDVTACPGTDTCKLGIASSRGLAGELRKRLIEDNAALDRAVKGLHIKVSGCFNSCGQHHAADLGFYGVSRNVSGRTVPHFQVLLGGQWTENAKSFGLAIGAVPSKRIPDVVSRITSLYREDARPGESFQEFTKRLGRARFRAVVDELAQVPPFESDRSFYSDWGDPREFTIGDLGKGECAGEVVSRFEFELAASEREIFEAQLRLEEGDFPDAAYKSYRAMLRSAGALVRLTTPELSSDSEQVVEEFRRRFYDTKLFYDPYAGPKFAHYFFRVHETRAWPLDFDTARQRIEEAQLFIEAVHACRSRWLESANRETRSEGVSHASP
jgi:sulfite reductase (ferredoxin)